MPQFTFTSPDGKRYTVAGPPGATAAQAFQILQGQIGKTPAAAPLPPTPRAPTSGEAATLRAHPELAPNAAPPPGSSGLRDFAGGMVEALGEMLGDPQSEIAARARLLHLPVPGSGGAAEVVGQIAGGGLAPGGVLEAPEALAGAAAREVPRATAPPPGTAQEAPRAAQAPGGPSPSPQAGAGATPASAASARAQSYARRIGLDWARLAAGTRAALTTIAEDARALERLNPAAVRRQAAVQELRIPVAATRGQLERDPVALRREAIASNTAEGQPIRDVDLAANRDLQANLEVLRGRAAGRRGTFEEPVNEEGQVNPASIRGATKTPTQVGGSAQGAIREKAKWSKKGYQALYKIARETEPEAKVPLAPVQALLTENPEIQHLGWVQSWLAKARGTLPRDAEGNLPELSEAKLAELHDLRSKANDIARTGGKEGYYAGQVVKAIDETMKEAPQGAAAWRRANAAFKAHQAEFADQRLVSKLAGQTKAGGDRQLALEQTWKRIATGSLEEIRQVKRSLLTGGTGTTRAAGRKAWRDLRGETVNRILEDARNVTSADEHERAVLTEAALRKSINRIPRENLEELIGKANTRELYQILRARRITTRSPVGGRTTQSGTVPNALVMAEGLLKHLPGVNLALGAKRAAQELAERGAAAREAKEAGISPLEQAARDVERMRTTRARREALAPLRSTLAASAPAASQPSAPGTIGDALNRPPP